MRGIYTTKRKTGTAVYISYMAPGHRQVREKVELVPNETSRVKSPRSERCGGRLDIDDLCFVFLFLFSEMHSDDGDNRAMLALKPELADIASSDWERSDEPSVSTVDGRKIYCGQDETPFCGDREV